MLTYKDCLHFVVCDRYPNCEPEKCEFFKNKADVAEVVRCKECVYWDGMGYEGRCEAPKNGLIREYTNYDDFCSYGEKGVNDG